MSDNLDTVVFFDGACNLCSAIVSFVMSRDRKQRFRFASLQSETAQQLLDEPSMDSIVLVVEGRHYRKSRAVLEIIRRLDAPWPAMYIFAVVPNSIADWIYDFIGNRRYQWFGKRDTCRVPKKDWRK